MKPIRLTMQAFGPFAGRETVDFREAIDSGLFGIYGQTGSGKSTIFNAMTFALFGVGARSDQDPTTFRSDHSDSELLTEVEFVFDVGDKRYVVRRRPDQMRPKQRGKGETKYSHEAWLFDASGMSVEAITLENSGKIVAEKKVGQVGDAIENLLGYGAQQFRQIVLLPQGKFEAFLASKTAERLSILRELFDVSLYRRLSEKIKEDSAAADKRVSDDRIICAQRLQAEGFATTDALTIGIAEAEVIVRSHEEEEKIGKANVLAAREAYEQGREVDGRFVASETALKNLRELKSLTPEIDAINLQVQKAEKATGLIDLEEQAAKASAELVAANTAAKYAKETAERASAHSIKAKQNNATQQSRAMEIDELRIEIATHESHLKVLERSVGAKSIADLALEKNKNAKQEFENAQKAVRNALEKVQSGTNRLKSGRLSEEKRQKLQVEKASLAASFAAVESFDKAKRELEASQQEYLKAEGVFQQLERTGVEAKTAFEEAETSLAEVQALHLAAKLEPGEPCSVCGSTEHPNPANGEVKNSGLTDVFRLSKQKYDAARESEKVGAQKLTAARTRTEVLGANFRNLPVPKVELSSLRANLKDLDGEMVLLGPEVSITSLEKELEELSASLAATEKLRDQKRDDHNKTELDLVTKAAHLEELLSSVPEGMRIKGRLEDKVASCRATFSEIETSLQNSSAEAAAAHEASILASKDLELSERECANCERRRVEAKGNFEKRLNENELSEVEFRSLKPSIARLSADRTKVEEHRRKLANAIEEVERTQKLVAGRERVDLDNFKRTLEQTEELLAQTTSRRVTANVRRDQLRKLELELREKLTRLDAAEKEAGPLRALAEMFNAQNSQKVDLETYAIGTMFELVLLAANERLGPMTSGRYYLERELEAGGRGRQGLGIQIHDIYTGKARSTSTLSGGESFIAALSLALGLADIVESSSGKVRLDTIFIDEGFGSLDTENGSGTLEQVLHVLNSIVGQSRTVGVISHVQTVQEAIPNGFYVRKSAVGSQIESRGVA